MEQGNRLHNNRTISKATTKNLEKKIAKVEVKVRMFDKLVEDMHLKPQYKPHGAPAHVPLLASLGSRLFALGSLLSLGNTYIFLNNIFYGCP